LIAYAREPWTRQRFSLAHELKHVLGHPVVESPTPAIAKPSLADCFAAGLLMPRRYVRAIWYEGTQSLAALSEHCGVYERAAAHRLQRLVLRELTARQIAASPTRRPSGPRRYERAATFVGAE
jgi:Zn-dependent peptidase ImmA (M78 family)